LIGEVDLTPDIEVTTKVFALLAMLHLSLSLLLNLGKFRRSASRPIFCFRKRLHFVLPRPLPRKAKA